MQDCCVHMPSKDSSHDLAFLESRGVRDFVHFTAANNLMSILERGLLPRTVLDAQGIKYLSTDSYRLEGKSVVNLSITNPNISLFYRKRKTFSWRPFAVLTLDPVLIADSEGEYLFTPTNAACRLARPCCVEELFSGNRQVFFDANWPTDNQAEVLIRGTINPAHIKSIQLPFGESTNPRAVAFAERLANLVVARGLECDVAFCDQYFDYNVSFLGQFGGERAYKRTCLGKPSSSITLGLSDESKVLRA